MFELPKWIDLVNLERLVRMIRCSISSTAWDPPDPRGYLVVGDPLDIRLYRYTHKFILYPRHLPMNLYSLYLGPMMCVP